MPILDRLGASLGMLRPRTLARTQRSVETLVSETRETRATLQELMQSMSAELRALRQEVTTLTLRESQLRSVLRADTALEEPLGRLIYACDEERISRHVADAIAGAELCLDPFPYAVVSDVFPEDFYAALIRGIPPVELFGDKAVNKQQLKVPFTLAPEYSRRIWAFFVHRIASHVLEATLVEKFRQPLQDWIALNWPALAADPFGPPMEFHTADGRIMLRGRGYRIRPHRDPKWGFLTCLLYLAREKDSESWGTQLYAVDEDKPARGAAPHWIDAGKCRLAAEVPFRRNSMLVFLNSTGAHGASIPDDAEPADLQRYIYQCRIGPSPSAIRALMQALPAEEVAMWAGKRGDY
jgi:hypothetical protein